MSDANLPTPEAAASDFIRTLIAADVRSGRHGGRVTTRFPPEPNGYPHIGHAKSICLNFGVAQEFGGTCNLRFDDTNPSTESVEYAEAIQQDVRWLGFDWQDRLFFASDYFEQLYQFARGLIRDGHAYVCSLSEAEIREYRGTVTEPGRESPYRGRSVAENLDLFERMRAGEFADGTHVLRARIDMASPNMLMRDPLLYRIRRVHHYRTGDAWPIYPMYDYAHCLSDAIENVTHSLCTLEFENNRELYDWVLDHAGIREPRPHQTEFARLNLNYTVVSKRKLLQLVREGRVSGWDDPRMPTLRGLRRRGYTPEAIRAFCEQVGVARANSTVDVAQLEACIRDDLNRKVPRVLCVLRPLRVVIENYPEGQSEELDAPYYPHDVPLEGSRRLPFSRVLYVEREDFQEAPPPGFFRLAPGREVRLRYAYLIRCTGVVKNEAGEVVELRCSYDPATRGGNAPDGRKVQGTLHWVSAEHALAVEVRLYDRLFAGERPELVEDFLSQLNPDSLAVLTARLEPAVAAAQPGDSFQFERLGYFCVDPDSAPGRLVFNRTVSLRDSWAKLAPVAPTAVRPATVEPPADTKRRRKRSRSEEPQLSPEQSAALASYRDHHGLAEGDARLLALDAELGHLFTATLAHHANPQGIANWLVNDLQRERKGRPLAELPLTGESLAELVALLDAGTIATPVAREIFAQLVAAGGSPRQIVQARGLEQLADPAQLQPVIAQILAAHPAQVAAYRGGKTTLLGFFVGQVMKVTQGKAKAQVVQELVREGLG